MQLVCAEHLTCCAWVWGQNRVVKGEFCISRETEGHTSQGCSSAILQNYLLCWKSVVKNQQITHALKTTRHFDFIVLAAGCPWPKGACAHLCVSGGQVRLGLRPAASLAPPPWQVPSWRWEASLRRDSQSLMSTGYRSLGHKNTSANAVETSPGDMGCYTLLLEALFGKFRGTVGGGGCHQPPPSLYPPQPAHAHTCTPMQSYWDFR